MPSSPSRQAELARLIELPFAHRGLHGGDVIENSRAGFEAAIAAGHGIELDVQPSSDGVAMVFHDAGLERLAEAEGPVEARSAAQLGRIRLKGSGETIPTLAEVLALIGSRVPLLIEIKSGPRLSPLCEGVLRALEAYQGPFAIMSFNPNAPHFFAQRAPAMLRGLVVTEAGKRWRGRIERRLALWRSHADFLAYDVRDLPSRFAAAQRAKGLPVLTWTCRGDAQRAHAALHADQIIYEVPAPA